MRNSTNKRDRGRPRFRPSAAQRRKVETLAAGGLTEREIAHILRVARSTLREHFGTQLEFGRAVVRGEALMALRTAVRRGNASAIKIMLGVTDLTPPPAPPAVTLGKKEAASIAAQQPAPPGWADLIGVDKAN